MWIPVIIIAWTLNGVPTWVNFPMVNFPFTSEEKCELYVSRVRESITKDPQYSKGYSVCIEVPSGQGLQT